MLAAGILLCAALLGCSPTAGLGPLLSPFRALEPPAASDFGVIIDYGPEAPIAPDLFAGVLDRGELDTVEQRWRMTVTVQPLLVGLQPRNAPVMLEITNEATGQQWFAHGIMGQCYDCEPYQWMVQGPPGVDGPPPFPRLKLRAYVWLAPDWIHATREMWIENPG